MARVTVEDCLKRVNNRFLLVHLGAKRVIQLRKGAKPLYEAPKNKEIVLALREIAAGEVDFESIEKIELDELATGTVALDQPSEEQAPEQEAQKETGVSAKDDSGDEETEQKDVTPDKSK